MATGLLGGVLPYIYSRADALKRTLGDVVSNPIGSAEQAVNNANDRAGNLNRLLSQVSAQGIRGLSSPQGQELANLYTEAYNPIGMTAKNVKKFSDTLNVPDKNKEYIQSSAESLAGQLRELGFKVDLQHSGSVMGSSSYLNVADPTTGRYLSQPFRLSNHSKGVYNSDKVIDLNSPDQFQKAIDFALKTRNQPVSASQKLIDERGLNTDEETLNYMTKVYKRAMSKEGSLSNSERKAVQFIDENGLTDIFQETSIPPVTIK